MAGYDGDQCESINQGGVLATEDQKASMRQTRRVDQVF